MKKNLTLLFFLSLYFSPLLWIGAGGEAIAQNLVPNPSFEDTVSCPDMGGQVWKAKYWHTLLFTPDYFHQCAPYPQFSVPSNNFNYQYASTGQAYMGLYTYQTNSTYREIIGAFLLTSLDSGVKYYINFKTSFAYSPSLAFNIATNKLGILFSTVNYLSSPPPINNFCQFYSDSIITDTLNWTTIRGSFIADSNYTFVSIGNFFDNANTDTINWPGNQTRSYYFLDDFCISTDSLYCEVWTGLSNSIFEEQLKVYPNPSLSFITIDNIPFDGISLDIYDLLGSVKKSFTVKGNNKLIIDISDLPVSIYSAIVRTKKSFKAKKFIKLSN